MSPVRLSADNSFCLSGSSTSLKRVNSISDIDFCEYFRGSAVELVSCLQEKQVLSKQCLLAVLSIGGEDCVRPFEIGLQKFASELSTGTAYRDLQKVKLDFLARLEKLLKTLDVVMEDETLNVLVVRDRRPLKLGKNLSTKIRKPKAKSRGIVSTGKRTR